MSTKSGTAQTKLRTTLAAVAAVACVALIGGCGNSDNAADNAAPSAEPDVPGRATPEGPFFGPCGLVSDEEVRVAFNMPQLPTVTRNSVGCVWQAADAFGPSVSFSWYRGSPMGREAAGSGLIGRPPEKIEIDGHPGFRGSAGDELCEIGVQFGGNFIHWSVTYADVPPTADACDVAKQLAELTVSRAK